VRQRDHVQVGLWSDFSTDVGLRPGLQYDIEASNSPEARMPSEITIAAADLLQSCVPVLSLTAYVPQWLRLVKNKSSTDMSLRAWILWSVSSSFALFYAVVQYQVTDRGLALVFSSTAALAFILATIFLIFRYRSFAGSHV
jgi:uncharacterized protein with PQ loop repeat